ncbi:MAG: biotin/lipoyl-binding protein [Oscillospiraceae bacterium]|nr:biotin/lipoyl-binding protein [Oscillospiraceae bacterium]MBO7373737.1 biotin/lipoyl-binding protein [Oscillospiraceae bacterium]
MKYKVTLNNRVYEVEVEEGEAMLVDEYELAAPAAPAPAYAAPAAAAPVAAAPAAAPAAPAGGALAAGTRVDAPLPGNVLMVKVAVGQAVKAGDVLVIIEAMKMENEVAAPCDGTVKQVVAQKGAVVETGAPLVVLG